MTIAKPPRIKPTSAEARLISRIEIPVQFIIAPAKIKRGIAISGNFVEPSKRTRAALGRLAMPELSIIPERATIPRDTAIGTFTRTRPSNPKNIRRKIILLLYPDHAISRAVQSAQQL